MNFRQKSEDLQQLLQELPEFAIAFSGGVDSGLLAAAAVRSGKTPLLITVRPPWVPEREYRDASATADFLGMVWHCIPMKMPDELKDNPDDRCYLCKKYILENIRNKAEENGIHTILDGSNADDSKDYRPGKKALHEFAVRSPLEECGFTKSEVRALAAQYSLAIWNKPAYSCLLTRFPHNTTIEGTVLSAVEKGEDILINEGFPEVRLRSHGNLARIEISPEDRTRFCTPERMDRINSSLKNIGFRYVSLDLEGYRCGKMDRTDKT